MVFPRVSTYQLTHPIETFRYFETALHRPADTWYGGKDISPFSIYLDHQSGQVILVASQWATCIYAAIMDVFPLAFYRYEFGSCFRVPEGCNNTQRNQRIHVNKC